MFGNFIFLSDALVYGENRQNGALTRFRKRLIACRSLSRGEIGHEHRSACHSLQQGPGKRPRFLSRCPQVSRGGCRSGLAHFCAAACGGCISSCRDERWARTLFHVRRLAGDDGIVESPESEVWRGDRGALGQSDHDLAPRKRKDRRVSAKASDGDWAIVEEPGCRSSRFVRERRISFRPAKSILR